MRVFDFLVACCILLAISPILVSVAIILRLSGEGEIIFRQKRVGYKGHYFYIFKFATMLKDSPNMGAGTLTMENDPRVLPLGKFLRKSKINELPQLINILLGDMALVGPRPLVPDGERLYPPEISRKIRSVRPGLTGIGSLALRDEETLYAHRSDAEEYYTNVIQPYKAQLELYYIENKSIFLDIKIIICTVLCVIYPKFNIKAVFSDIP